MAQLCSRHSSYPLMKAAAEPSAIQTDQWIRCRVVKFTGQSITPLLIRMATETLDNAEAAN